MSTLMIGAGLIFVAAITPGPNNLVVMRAAAHEGFAGALPAIAGIVAGGLAMLALVMAGTGFAVAVEPRMTAVITLCGGAYLCWLGGSLVVGSFASSHTRDSASKSALPTRAAALFGFQFLNPKSWVMVLTVATAVRDEQPARAFLSLATLFTVIPALCLALWCALGLLAAPYLDRVWVRDWLDRAMGVLLFVSAALLVHGQAAVSHA